MACFHGNEARHARFFMLGLGETIMKERLLTSLLVLAFSSALAYAQEALPHAGLGEKGLASLPPGGQVQENSLQQDPQLVTGQLENGFRYIIRPTREPVGRGSVRLYVDTGSMDETHENSGVSHFLEHLVFNGSRSFKRGELIPTMQRLGLGFGGDANAYTSLLQTVYMLDLPNLKEETVNFALTIMRDFADGATLSDDAIDHERGIVISELKQRDSESYRAVVAMLGQLAKGTRVAGFMPIGKEDIIRNISYDAVRQYYKEHYVPERMTLILTGDFAPEEAEAWVRRHFGSMEKRPNPPHPWVGEQPDAAPSELVVANKEQAHATMAVSVVSPYRGKPDTFSQRMEDLPLELANAMLHLRLERMSQQADSPFLKASVNRSVIFDVAEAFSLDVTAAPGKWQEALFCAEQELRRAIRYGFSPQELQEAIASYKASLNRSAEAWDTVTADAMASKLVEALSNHSAMTTPQEDMRAFEAGARRILSHPELCQAALAKAYDPGKAKLTMSGAIPEGVFNETLRRAYEESAKVEVREPEWQETKPFAYDNVGAPGSIVQQESMADIGVTSLVLSNGVKVNLKPLDFSKGNITVTAAIDGGALSLPSKPGLAMAIQSVMNLGGLEAHSLDELNRLMLGRNVSLNFSTGDTRFLFSGGTTADDLELQCKLIAAGIMHPAFREESVALMRRNLPNLYRRLATTPQGAYAMQAPRALYGDDVRFTIPTQEEVESIGIQDIKEALAPALQQGAMEVSLVGDFDVQAVLPILERTFGAMPPRRADFLPVDDAQRRVGFQPWGQRRFFRYPTKLDKTIVSQVRPIGNGMDKRRNRRLQLLASIVRERLFDGIRAAMGESYSPSVKLGLNAEYPNAATITTASAGVKRNREKVNAAMDSILAGIGQGRITEDDFECAIRPMLAQAEKSLRTPDFWNANVVDLQSNKERLGLIRDMMDDLKSITCEEIRHLGKEVFGKDNANYFFTVPQDYQPAPAAEDEKKEPAAGGAAKLPVPGYTVITTEATAALPEWRRVAETLAAKYEGAQLVTLPQLTEDACTRALQGASARYAAYVLRPEEVGRETVNDLHRAARKVDDDPWGDCIWGIVTGFSAQDAQRIADAREPLVIKRLLATTNVDASHFEHSCCITDWTGSPVFEQDGYQKPQQKPERADSSTPEGRDILENGTQGIFAGQLEHAAPQLLVTSSHATQFNLEMPFSKGLLFSVDNSFRRLPLPQTSHFAPALQAAAQGDMEGLRHLPGSAPIEPDGTPRVWLAAGNCLLGDVAYTKHSMAVTALSAYTCRQLIGYTVPSWYGAGGWGSLSLFFENSNGTTLAEAWFLNNQFILERTMELDPKLLNVRFNEACIGPELQRDIIRQKPAIALESAKDAIGLVHDRDVVAFYGDPAWSASLDCSHVPCPYSIEWQGDKQFTITANQDTQGRFAVWFPTAATGDHASGCNAEGAVFTDDFILFPRLGMKKGERMTVKVE